MTSSNVKEREGEAQFVHIPGVIASEFGTSMSEARRLVNQGGAKLDGKPVLDFDLPASAVTGKTLAVGKRRKVEL